MRYLYRFNGLQEFIVVVVFSQAYSICIADDFCQACDNVVRLANSVKHVILELCML